ncbi:MAG: carbohydrate porin [Phycisphaerae bacterium]|nr:carbohydrate porin [Phycisphaerae bacterium]
MQSSTRRTRRFRDFTPCRFLRESSRAICPLAVALVFMWVSAPVFAQEEKTESVAEPVKTADAAPEPAPTETRPPPEAIPAQPPDRLLSLESRTMTGDWGGLRNDLAEKGVKINLFLNDQFQGVVQGGLDTNSDGRNAGSSDMFVSIDFEKLGLFKNGELLGHFQSNWGAGANPKTGTLFQVNDDADGDLDYHVAQFWYRHYFFDHKVHLTLGYLDFQTIVDRNVFSNSEDKQFWNQGFDNNPLVPLNIGWGAALILQPVKWFSLVLGAGDDQAGLYHGDLTTVFHEDAHYKGYLEADFHADWKSSRGPLPGNFRIGTVYDPGNYTAFSRSAISPHRENNQFITYISADQLLYREKKESEQGLGIFARYSYRDPDFYRIYQHWSAGLQYLGAIPGRDKDVIGWAVGQQQSSDVARRRVNRRFGDETVYEMYYAIHVSPWLVITPDVQYIDNPGGNDQVGHTMVAGIRVRISV